MTVSSRREDPSKSLTYGNVYPQDASAPDLRKPRRWPALILELRNQLGISQTALADHLGVTQASVSRWENAKDIPSIRARKAMREMMRTSDSSRLTQQLKARLRYTPFPMSAVGLGARFLAFSNSFASETATNPRELQGRSIYGTFGESVDATTKIWERSGIFEGKVAMALTVLSLTDRGGNTFFLKNFDTPYRIENNEFITICETRRIKKSEYDNHIKEYGSPVFYLHYDEIAD